MAKGIVVLLLLSRAACAAGATSAGAGISRSGAEAAAPLLLSLLRQLRSEAEASARVAGAEAQWCEGARHQRAGLAVGLRRQLHEAALAGRRLALEEEQLTREWSLANSTAREQEQQFQDASAAGGLALASLAEEGRDLSRTLQAAGQALRLLQGEHSSSLGDASQELASSLTQLSSDQMPDSDRSLVSSFVHDTAHVVTADGSAGSARSQKVLQLLARLRDQAETSRTAALQEEQAAHRKLGVLTDGLSSSILEARSQAASLRAEVAQKQRERARLDGKSSEVSALLSAVIASEATLQGACAEEEAQRKEVAAHIASESGAITALLKEMPSSASALLWGGAEVAKAPSLLQVMSEDDAQGSSEVGAATVEDPVDGALRSIRHFAEAAAADSGEDSVPVGRPHAIAVAAARPTSGRLSLRGKTAGQGPVPPAAHSAVAQLEVKPLLGCEPLLRDASADGAALARSSKRAGAKLHVAKAAMTEYEQGIFYSRAQQRLLETQLKQFDELSKVADRLGSGAESALREHGVRLASLASDLSQRSSSDEQRVSQIMDGLAQKVESHRSDLVKQRARTSERRSALEAAQRAVLRLLADSESHARRRLANLKSEVQLLASAAAEKESDRLLSQQYRELVGRLCTGAEAAVAVAA